MLENKMDLEKISCLMVTKGNTDSVRYSLKMFQQQTYPVKEMVVVTDPGQMQRLSNDLNLDNNNNIQFVDSAKCIRNATLGDLRNLAISSAQGEYICQWDDDDLYHPRRLEIQMGLLKKHSASVCLLNQWIIWWPIKKRFVISNKRHWEGSLLANKSIMPNYLSLTRGEDTPVVENLIKNHPAVSIKNPYLYIYVVHGNNTFDEAHFELMYGLAEAKFEGEICEKFYQKLSESYLLNNYPIPRN